MGVIRKRRRRRRRRIGGWLLMVIVRGGVCEMRGFCGEGEFGNVVSDVVRVIDCFLVVVPPRLCLMANNVLYLVGIVCCDHKIDDLICLCVRILFILFGCFFLYSSYFLLARGCD